MESLAAVKMFRAIVESWGKVDDVHDLGVLPWSNEAVVPQRSTHLCRLSHNQRNVLSLPCYKITGSWREMVYKVKIWRLCDASLFSFFLSFMMLLSSRCCVAEIPNHYFILQSANLLFLVLIHWLTSVPWGLEGSGRGSLVLVHTLYLTKPSLV